MYTGYFIGLLLTQRMLRTVALYWDTSHISNCISLYEHRDKYEIFRSYLQSSLYSLPPVRRQILFDSLPPRLRKRERERQREENIKVCNEAREGGRGTRSNFGELIYCLTHTCGFSHTYTRTPTQTDTRIQTKYRSIQETKITSAWYYALIYFWLMQ